MRNTTTAALLATLLATGPALAQPAPPRPAAPTTEVRTAADLGAVCQPTQSGVARLESIAYCQGYLTAAGQYHAALNPTGGSRRAFCLPEPAPTVAQSGVAYAAWVQADPSRGTEPALASLLGWARATYPCPAAATARPGARR